MTAQNTLTGKRYSTTTDITGAWSLNIPQNGRYVIRTQFAAFAQGSQEALLNATTHDASGEFRANSGFARGSNARSSRTINLPRSRRLFGKSLATGRKA